MRPAGILRENKLNSSCHIRQYRIVFLNNEKRNAYSLPCYPQRLNSPLGAPSWVCSCQQVRRRFPCRRVWRQLGEVWEEHSELGTLRYIDNMEMLDLVELGVEVKIIK